jgi:hypothetical protein
MAANLVGAVLQLKGLTATEKLVLVALANHCNSKTLRCDPGIELVAGEVGIDRRHVFRILGDLTQKGLLIRHSGQGRGHHNRYAFPPAIVGQRQPGLWDEKVTSAVTINQQGKGDISSKEKVTSTHEKVTPRSHSNRKKGKEPEVPYGRLDAAAAYRRALADLPQNGNRRGQVAVLVDFTRAHCPALANAGRLAALIRDHEAPDVLWAVWQAAAKAEGNPLDYVQGMLRQKRAPSPAASGELGWAAASRQGQPHAEGEDG